MHRKANFSMSIVNFRRVDIISGLSVVSSFDSFSVACSVNL